MSEKFIVYAIRKEIKSIAKDFIQIDSLVQTECRLKALAAQIEDMVADANACHPPADK